MYLSFKDNDNNHVYEDKNDNDGDDDDDDDIPLVSWNLNNLDYCSFVIIVIFL